ncbi:hypothetical protein COB18_00990 [Candidatus Kaiserbacteria bacterium]|nr:MAG: hypothetical protein COB80_02315 [Candidatus Kaiserbacteria bacterium]PCI90312.1 MAG: hypothetical protein COB18_00990 [Candidatus Kaiserbacteria bacterium]
MGQNTFQKIHEIIEKSNLSNEEKRDFTELFAQTKESALRPVLTLLTNDPIWIEKLYKNYRAKKDAMVTGNMEAWKDAITKEKEELELV